MRNPIKEKYDKDYDSSAIPQSVKDAFDKYYEGSYKWAQRRKHLVHDLNRIGLYAYQYDRDFVEDGYTEYDIDYLQENHKFVVYSDEDEFKKLISEIPSSRERKDCVIEKPINIIKEYKHITGVCDFDWTSNYKSVIYEPDKDISRFDLYLKHDWTDYWELEDIDRTFEALGYFRQKPDLTSSSYFLCSRIMRYFPYTAI